ncbi:hypothetical protein H340_06136 [Streptomyces mobaraensis NBRC 13819 = DSM 40847]|uniref:DUF6801 domain-containing protein n=1 Tax=Streptomyces mobaraensis (strain ATCC 29032 / DSM 40847 / JCM 4168 / NBRC 13819 / NCIMB 11159 / IPCR 16-22) TaxID=1223523 RepID=M3CBU9_STRM1|nr:hypothetical protein H340_06136 [Streptomyces mobaraensis NBRC 13819 = DSM 40847]
MALWIAGTAVVGLDAGPAAADPTAITQQYTCDFPSPAGRQSVTLRLNSAIPTTAVVGKPTPAFPLSADAPVNGGIAAALRFFGVSSVEGTVDAKTVVVAPEGDIDRDVLFTVPRTTIGWGSSDIKGTGTAPRIVLDKPGSAKITVRQLTLHLTTRDANGGVTSPGEFTAPCTLSAGNGVVASFDIARADGSGAPGGSTGPGISGSTGTRGSGTSGSGTSGSGAPGSGAGSGATAPPGTTGADAGSSGAPSGSAGGAGGADLSAVGPDGQGTTPTSPSRGAGASPARGTDIALERTGAAAEPGGVDPEGLVYLSIGVLTAAVCTVAAVLHLRQRRRRAPGA